MSRTHKDKPYDVRTFQKAKNSGRINHTNHELFGTVNTKTVKGETRHFSKAEPIQLYDYKAYLDNEGILYKEKEETLIHSPIVHENGKVSYEYKNPERMWRNGKWQLFWMYGKKVEVTTVTTYSEVIWLELTDQCTDVHDLKVDLTSRGGFIDKNTGKEAVCVPDYWDYGRRSYINRPKYGKNSRIESRSNAKQAAWKAVKSYRAGELEEDFDDIHLNTLVLSSKGCYCCG